MTTQARLVLFREQYSGDFFAREKCKNLRFRMLPGNYRALQMTSSALKYLDIPQSSRNPFTFIFLTSMGHEYPSCEILYGPETPS